MAGSVVGGVAAIAFVAAIIAVWVVRSRRIRQLEEQAARKYHVSNTQALMHPFRVSACAGVLCMSSRE